MILGIFLLRTIAVHVEDSTRKYLNWLKSITDSLRSNVQKSTNQTAAEAGLAIALYGTVVAGVGLSFLLAKTWMSLPVPVIFASTRSTLYSSGGSSCGSDGCSGCGGGDGGGGGGGGGDGGGCGGGGGGCGGGGCGGGGCGG